MSYYQILTLLRH